MKNVLIFLSILTVVMFAVTFWRGDLLAGIFSRDPEVIFAAADYLKAYAIDCLLTCFLFCFIGFFNGLGHTGFVMIQGILAAFLIRVPVAWYMARITGELFHIGLAVPCSTVAEIAVCFLFRRIGWTRQSYSVSMAYIWTATSS